MTDSESPISQTVSMSELKLEMDYLCEVIRKDIPRRYQDLLIRQDYDRNIGVMFEIMNIINTANPELYKSTTKRIEENGGTKTLFRYGPSTAATLVCKHLIAAAKEIDRYRNKADSN